MRERAEARRRFRRHRCYRDQHATPLTPVDQEERAARLALSRVPGAGVSALRRLLEAFGSLREAFEAGDLDLAQVPQLGAKVVDGIREAAAAQDGCRQELQQLQDEGVAVLVWEELPPALRATPDAPQLLYVRGGFTLDDWLSLAVIGSRAATPKALEAAVSLSTQMARRGVTVVSGLAAGVDSAAHGAALSAGGRSIAVLACGIRHRLEGAAERLSRLMLKQGAVVSELKPDARPIPKQFMIRDRIIAGLSLGTVVVQAGEGSGTLDTARRALKYGRPVMVVNWNGDGEGTAGNRQLLQAGARPLEPGREPAWDELLAECEEAGRALNPLRQ